MGAWVSFAVAFMLGFLRFVISADWCGCRAAGAYSRTNDFSCEMVSNFIEICCIFH